MAEKIKVAVVGASGYSGEELVRLLLKHPNVELTAITSRANAGKRIGEVYPRFAKSELVFCNPDVSELAKLAQPGQPLYGIQHTNEGKIVIFGGGEPLEVEGKIIGALGVSGGTAEQDTMLAAYGKEILKEVISCQKRW